MKYCIWNYSLPFLYTFAWVVRKRFFNKRTCKLFLTFSCVKKMAGAFVSLFLAKRFDFLIAENSPIHSKKLELNVGNLHRMGV